MSGEAKKQYRRAGVSNSGQYERNGAGKGGCYWRMYIERLYDTDAPICLTPEYSQDTASREMMGVHNLSKEFDPQKKYATPLHSRTNIPHSVASVFVEVLHYFAKASIHRRKSLEESS